MANTLSRKGFAGDILIFAGFALGATISPVFENGFGTRGAFGATAFGGERFTIPTPGSVTASCVWSSFTRASGRALITVFATFVSTPAAPATALKRSVLVALTLVFFAAPLDFPGGDFGAVRGDVGFDGGMSCFLTPGKKFPLNHGDPQGEA